MCSRPSAVGEWLFQYISNYHNVALDSAYYWQPGFFLFFVQGKGLASGGDISDGATSSSNDLAGFSERFVNWVTYGDMLFPWGRNSQN